MHKIFRGRQRRHPKVEPLYLQLFQKTLTRGLGNRKPGGEATFVALGNHKERPLLRLPGTADKRAPQGALLSAQKSRNCGGLACPNRSPQGIWTLKGDATNLPRPEMQQLGSVLVSIRQPRVTGNKCSRIRAWTVQRIATEVVGLSKKRVHRCIVDPRAPSGDNLVEESTHRLRLIVTGRAGESPLAVLPPCRSRGAERLKRLRICLEFPFEERNTQSAV